MHKIIKTDCDHIIERLGDLSYTFAGKTILMTGFAGFLGSYITQYFQRINQTMISDNPVRFIGIDDFSRGMSPWVKNCMLDKNIQVISHDIRNPLPDNVFTERINYILHGASIASPIYYRKNPIKTMDTNIIGLRQLLDFTLVLKERMTIESFLFFSTSEVYGDPVASAIPTKETYRGRVSCTGPRACYDESKRYGEALCVNFYRIYNLPIKIVRPFNNYGPGLKITDRRVIPDFFRNIFRGEDIKLYSDGRATRTFCYIADATVGYLKLLLSNINGEAVNIGTDNPEISILNLAERIVDIAKWGMKTNPSISFKKNTDNDYLVDNPNRRCPDISKARRILKFEPMIDINEGLKRTFFWYKDHQISSEN